jgi:asparagine synthase (glutamine-hydrolysing)
VFRYIALAWDDALPMDAAGARQLGRELRARPDWHDALHCRGLQVFAKGARPGVNGAYRLLDGHGVVLGRLFRRCDLGSPAGGDVTLTGSEAEHILKSAGRALIRDYWGRYVAFIRTGSGSTRVLRDPSGTLPCFMIEHEGVSIVFSWLEDALELLSHAQLPGVDWEALAAHLLLGDLGGRETALEGVSQILPGQIVDLRTGESAMLWSAVDIARSPAAHSAVEAAGQLHSVVGSCARAWASCYDTILFRLSGGVDSSILLSCLAIGGTQADVICVNYHSRGSDSDERHYARLSAARAGRDLIERERDPVFRIDRILQMARTPSPVPYIGWMNGRADARLAAAHSAAAMFTGAGGDQLFFEFPCWWPVADYLRLRGLDAGFASAAMDAARLGKVSVWRAVALAFVDRVHPTLLAQEPSNHAALLGQSILRKELRRERFVHPALLRPTGLPIGKRTQTRALMHPVGYYDPFEQGSAPELVNPLLSQPLVELCLGLPTYLLTQGGRGRALARRAFAGDLPPQIATRRSKGGMEEHITEVLLSNLDFARGMLIEGELVRRGLLDRAKVEELLSGRPTPLSGHPSQIHALIGVEAWLSRWSIQRLASRT